MDAAGRQRDRVTVAMVAERLRTSGLEVEIVGDPATVVSGMSHDSRVVEAGILFGCFRGEHADGHEHATAAVAAGATALLVDHVLEQPARIAQLVVADTRLAAGPAAAISWGDADTDVVIVGITGTNGKTTTAQMVATMFEAAGVRCGVIGTLHGPRTTPEAPDLHRMIREFVSTGHGAVVMEVSSHALALHRVDGTDFDVVAFTNFGHDHLDLHGSPEEYFRAKARLFSPDFAPTAVINTDDVHGRLIADTLRADVGDAPDVPSMRLVEVSRDDLTDIHVSADRHEYTLDGHRVTVGLGGDFNVDNSHVAIRVFDQVAVGGPDDRARATAALSSIGSVPGRFEVIRHPATDERGFTVVVDYAHTPDGLEGLLASARMITTGRLISVFGCAGRRDREKRPAMGAIAARRSDIAIATSDNPRGEDPDAIIDDVLGGVDDRYRSRVTRQPDRRLAVRHAIDIAESGDVVVIAGKGHETYQDLGTEVIDFDDRVVAREELDALRRSAQEDAS